MNVQAIDVGSGTTVRLAPSTKLFIHGPQSQSSIVRPGGKIVNSQAYFGGPGKIVVNGTFEWRSLPTGGSTIATRWCGAQSTPTALFCSGPVTGARGLMQIGNAGLLDIPGRGVNLKDQYQLQVQGTVRLRNDGYVAADRGTSLALVPKSGATGVGQLQILNDGGWLEGFTLYGQNTLSSVNNGGSITKTAGTGSSMIQATYTRTGAGAVSVTSGTLVLPAGVTAAATVGSQDSYGFGTCTVDKPGNLLPPGGCPVDTTVTSTQAGLITLPASVPNAQVTLRPDTSVVPTGTIGVPVLAEATGLSASATNPAILTLRFDDQIVPAGRNKSNLVIRRQATGSTSETSVVNCLTGGVMPAGQPACVDRAASVDVDGDVVMVVRTTGFSRWRAR